MGTGTFNLARNNYHGTIDYENFESVPNKIKCEIITDFQFRN